MNILAELLAICRDLAAGNVGALELPGVLRALADRIGGEGEPSYRVTEAGIAALDKGERTARRLSRPERVALALAMLGSYGRVSSGEIAQLSGVNRETARGDLAALASEGKCEALGENRGRVYRAK